MIANLRGALRAAEDSPWYLPSLTTIAGGVTLLVIMIPTLLVGWLR